MKKLMITAVLAFGLPVFAHPHEHAAHREAVEKAEAKAKADKIHAAVVEKTKANQH